jgi:hypothetical protein
MIDRIAEHYKLPPAQVRGHRAAGRQGEEEGID